MNYEKKYKEALEKARKIRGNCDYDDSNVIESIESIFPELKESEDERIRKEIIEYFQADFAQGIARPDWLAWLEKQKEQKSNIDLNFIFDWLRQKVQYYMNCEYNRFHKCMEYDGTIDVEGLIEDLRSVLIEK